MLSLVYMPAVQSALPRGAGGSDADRARRDALLACQIDSMVSRRHRRPISLPRPPQVRGR